MSTKSASFFNICIYAAIDDIIAAADGSITLADAAETYDNIILPKPAKAVKAFTMSQQLKDITQIFINAYVREIYDMGAPSEGDNIVEFTGDNDYNEVFIPLFEFAKLPLPAKLTGVSDNARTFAMVSQEFMRMNSTGGSSVVWPDEEYARISDIFIRVIKHLALDIARFVLNGFKVIAPKMLISLLGVHGFSQTSIDILAGSIPEVVKKAPKSAASASAEKKPAKRTAKK